MRPRLAARGRVDCSRCRWIVEADPQGRTTGCRIEARQVYTAERLIRLIRWLGLLSPMAVRLLQVRDVARRAPASAAVGCCRAAWPVARR